MDASGALKGLGQFSGVGRSRHRLVFQGGLPEARMAEIFRLCRQPRNIEVHGPISTPHHATCKTLVLEPFVQSGPRMSDFGMKSQITWNASSLASAVVSSLRFIPFGRSVSPRTSRRNSCHDC